MPLRLDRDMVYNGAMRKFFHCKLLILMVFSSAFSSRGVYADEIYKWVDSKGMTHYSSKPGDKKAEVAKLPEITRGEVKMPSTLLDSCKNHAGIDCQGGPDKDGSVKCNDGFLDSAQRYTFLCTTAKLEVSSVSKVDRGGGFTVQVRNSKSVAADKPKLVYRFDSKTDYELSGPESIQPFELAEFIFDPDAHLSEKGRMDIVKKIKPSADKFELACANCP
jgi:hypothetical protein